MLDKVEFAIPIFHCYGHKSSCQVYIKETILPIFHDHDNNLYFFLLISICRLNYRVYKKGCASKLDSCIITDSNSNQRLI